MSSVRPIKPTVNEKALAVATQIKQEVEDGDVIEVLALLLAPGGKFNFVRSNTSSVFDAIGQLEVIKQSLIEDSLKGDGK